MIDLRTVERREKLKARASSEPYWQPLSAGQYLGFRPSAGSGLGTWLARFYDPDTARKPNRSLGDFGTLPPNKRFDAAKREAEEWFRHLSRGGSEDDVTVRQACERYAASNADAAKRFPRYVYGDPIAQIRLRRLREHHVREWRARLESMPALVTRNKLHQPVTRKRAAATVNRDMVAFRAALNAALSRGEVDTALAWRKALQPVANANGRRDLYLDKMQRRALLAAQPADAAAFCRGLCLLPLRPGALAGLTAGDFDARTGTLVIKSDKANADRRILLPQDTATLLKDQASGKLPRAPLFARADGRPWDKDAWKGPVKDAARTAALPESVTAYTLRHSTITDLVTGGLDLLTVAQISGTSVRMIEKHYGHLRGERAAAALAGLAL
ncbi:integrase [Pseudoxanthomonas daejeonensis]|uniref:Integrase n=1 Tax=Pseudoxanthomonas daejeonensis TaxID=266062 RepID=A0ABQ6Z7Q6_9GAMM|nr:integrase [Pseudoxanthomonas daejeonensis]